MFRFAAMFSAALITFSAQAQDPTIAFTKDDARMNAAIAAARDSFDGFWKSVEGADGITVRGASVKVAAPYGDGNAEHIWMGPCKRLEPSQYVCMVQNEPVNVSAKLGDPFLFAQDQISDWMIMRDDGMIEGAYTLRVMLPTLPEDQAEALRKRLAPLPD